MVIFSNLQPFKFSMKKTIFFFVFCFGFCTFQAQLFAQNTAPATETLPNTITTSFKVWGNCGMCKRTIERSLKINGVKYSNWNVDSKMLTVSYSPKKITAADIHKRVAAVGYDTEKERAADEVYNKLHSCCQCDAALKQIKK
jgi:periplasmic mercuric ion binding protein